MMKAWQKGSTKMAQILLIFTHLLLCDSRSRYLFDYKYAQANKGGLYEPENKQEKQTKRMKLAMYIEAKRAEIHLTR